MRTQQTPLILVIGVLLACVPARAAQAQQWLITPTRSVPGAVTVTNLATGRPLGSPNSAGKLWRLPASGDAVSLVNGKGGGKGSATNLRIPLVYPPAPVARPGLERVVLTWAPVPGAAGYAVKRAASTGGPYTGLATVSTDSTTYTDITGTPGTTYYYTVSATGTPHGPLASAPVAARPTTTVTDVSVRLDPWFNTVGIQPDGWRWAGGGYNGQGYAYSAALTGSTLTWHGDLFTLGPMARPNCLADAGQRIVLPSGNFSSLLLLGSYLGSSPTSTGTFRPRLTYTDGSSTVLSLGMTNWRGRASQSGESDAAAYPYRVTGSGTRQSVPCYVHGYRLPIDPTKTTQWLDLPDTGTFRLLAMDLDAGPSILSPGASLSVGQYLTSPSKTCFLTQQADGSLVLYAGSGPAHQGAALWASGAHATPGDFHTSMQADGNIVTYTGTLEKQGGVHWASATYGNPNAFLEVTDAQQVQVVNGTNVVWQKP